MGLWPGVQNNIFQPTLHQISVAVSVFVSGSAAALAVFAALAALAALAASVAFASLAALGSLLAAAGLAAAPLVVLGGAAVSLSGPVPVPAADRWI